jgi:hypothetical protein
MTVYVICNRCIMYIVVYSTIYTPIPTLHSIGLFSLILSTRTQYPPSNLNQSRSGTYVVPKYSLEYFDYMSYSFRKKYSQEVEA